MDLDNLDLNKSGAFIIGLSDCGEKITSAGGRVSTQDGTVLGIWQKSQDCEKNAKLIDKVTRSGHNSVVEHTYFNLAFQNVTAVVEQFVIEFRLASFTVKSRRYVDFSDAGFFIPEDADENYKSHMAKLFGLYSEFCEAGVPKEDARFLLPYCLFSNFFCSINGREFLHLLKAMLYGRGSKYPEIVKLGRELKEQAEKLTPGIMTGFDERSKSYMPDNPDLSFIGDVPRRTNGKKVELLSYTGDAEKNVQRSALISYTNASTEDIDRILSDDTVADKITYSLVHSSRPRALEAADFTLRFNDVSLSGITHFTRHRMQSIEIPELIRADRKRHIVPESVKKDPELLLKYETAFKENAAEYERLRTLGKSEESLVYYLLSGNTLDIVTTMNARELLTFMKLRTCSRAQWEIRAHAVEALELLRKAAPGIFKYYGPSCFISSCPEGRFCCGRQEEMRKSFSM